MTKTESRSCSDCISVYRHSLPVQGEVRHGHVPHMVKSLVPNCLDVLGVVV